MRKLFLLTISRRGEGKRGEERRGEERRGKERRGEDRKIKTQIPGQPNPETKGKKNKNYSTL